MKIPELIKEKAKAFDGTHDQEWLTEMLTESIWSDYRDTEDFSTCEINADGTVAFLQGAYLDRLEDCYDAADATTEPGETGTEEECAGWDNRVSIGLTATRGTPWRKQKGDLYEVALAAIASA